MGVATMPNHILEGTWSEVSTQAAGLKANARVRLEVFEPKSVGTMIRKGMFPGLRNLTDKDFDSAEWHEIEKDSF